MGQNCSHMNTFALQAMVSLSKRMLFDLWGIYLSKYPERTEFSINRAEIADITKELQLTDSGMPHL